MKRTKESLWPLLAAILLLSTMVSGCGSRPPTASEPAAALAPVQLAQGEALRVVATTNIIGDIVRNVGGSHLALTVLMDVGIDPHSYVPTPSDTAALHDAHLVFANGLGLEADLEEMFQSAGGDALHINLSHELEDLLEVGEAQHEEDAHQDGGTDPHVWLDAQNVIHWVQTIERVLSTLNPDNAPFYDENARIYTGKLESLDTWIVEKVNSLPAGRRQLVTNHPAFGYLARRYGLEQIGAIYPVSPSAEPSARDVAELEDAIREFGVPAVFTESTVNTKLAQQVADDTGVSLVQLFSGSLGEPGSGAETYLQFMRYNVSAIVHALD